jgi:hypothetical protein
MFGYWRIISIEGYCLIDLEYIRKHSPKMSRIIFKEDGDMEFEPEENEEYDPNVTVPDFPSYCKKEICYACLENDCPYFGYTEYTGENNDE